MEREEMIAQINEELEDAPIEDVESVYWLLKTELEK